MFPICLLPTAGLRSRRKHDTASASELFFHVHGSSSGAYRFHACGSCSGAAILELEKAGKPLQGQGKKQGIKPVV